MSEGSAQVMTMMMDSMLHERDNTTSLDKSIKNIVDANGRFGGKDVTRYLEYYKTQMRKMDILLAR